jgi:hypothetical protein
MQKHGIETLGMLDTGHGGRRLAAATTADHSRASLTTAMAGRSCQSRPCGSSTQVGRWISADVAMGELDPSQAVGSHRATAGPHHPWRRRGTPSMEKGRADHEEEGTRWPWRRRAMPAMENKGRAGVREEAMQHGRPPRHGHVRWGRRGRSCAAGAPSA